MPNASSPVAMRAGGAAAGAARPEQGPCQGYRSSARATMAVPGLAGAVPGLPWPCQVYRGRASPVPAPLRAVPPSPRAAGAARSRGGAPTCSPSAIWRSSRWGRCGSLRAEQEREADSQ